MKAKKLTSVAASILVATSMVFGAASINPAAATDIKRIANTSAAAPDFNIKYVGEQDGYVFIKISLTQLKEQKSYLEIKDVNGDNLYRETVTGKEFSRVVKISPDELSAIQVSVYVAGKQTATKAFAINTSFSTSYEVSEVAE